MGVIKDKNIKRLASMLSSDKPEDGSFCGRSDSLKALYDELLKTEDKKERARLLADFRKRNEEFSAFLSKNPELLKAELERAVIMAAVGGTTEETEVTIDGRGRKRIKQIRKKTAPNAAAALKYLEKAAPEKWGGNTFETQPENNLFDMLMESFSEMGKEDVENREDGED